MHARRIVARVLEGVQLRLHAARFRALSDVAYSAVTGSALSLTQLALGAERRTTLRHRVKCVDRLLGNRHLHSQREALYQVLAQRWLAGTKQLLIVVDWSSLTPDMQWHWLRAAVVVQGRSLTLYEEVHPREHLGSLAVHRRFLKRLAGMIPDGALPPIVLTDAGFRNPWFRLVARQGWHWIGRVRNRDFVRAQANQPWFPLKQLYQRATAQAQELGLYETVRNNPLTCRLVLIKKPPAGRKCRYASGREARHSQVRKIAAANREPWLLSSSIAAEHMSAAAIVALYAQRMRIEQQFRDTKNAALGLGLSRSRSRDPQRLQVLLLLSHIALLALRLLGEAAKSQRLNLYLVCTTRKTRPEISVLTVARRLLDQPALLSRLRDPWRHLLTLRQQVDDAVQLHSVST